MKIIPSDLFHEILVIEPDILKDKRGCFLETYRVQSYSDYGMPVFVQDNVSFSTHGVLRGLHYQAAKPQGKLVTVIYGEVLDVAVDVRRGSPSFGLSLSIILSSSNGLQLYIPEGFAHGFCVMSETACVHYKCTDYYDPSVERGVIWNDPLLGIKWPIEKPILSVKDKNLPVLCKIPDHDLPKYVTGK